MPDLLVRDVDDDLVQAPKKGLVPIAAARYNTSPSLAAFTTGGLRRGVGLAC